MEGSFFLEYSDTSSLKSVTSINDPPVLTFTSRYAIAVVSSGGPSYVRVCMAHFCQRRESGERTVDGALAVTSYEGGIG